MAGRSAVLRVACTVGVTVGQRVVAAMAVGRVMAAKVVAELMVGVVQAGVEMGTATEAVVAKAAGALEEELLVVAARAGAAPVGAVPAVEGWVVVGSAAALSVVGVQVEAVQGAVA